MPLRPVEKTGGHAALKFRGKNIYYGWIVLIALFIAAIISFGATFSFGVFFKSLEVEFSLTRAMTSSIYSVYWAIYAIFAMVGGWAMDKYGARALVSAMGFFTGLSLLLSSLVDKPWQLFLTLSLIMAIATGPYFTVMAATATKWFVLRRGLALGIVTSGIGTGILIMTPVSAHLIATYGWQNAYFILGIISMVVMIPCAQLLREPSPSQKTPTVPARSQQEPIQSKLKDFLLQAARRREFWLLFSIQILLSFTFIGVTTHLVPHAIDLGIDPIRAASILSFLGAMGIAGKVAMGKLSDTLGRQNSMIVCCLFTATAMLLLIWASDLWTLYLATLVFAFFAQGLTPSLAALTGDIFGLYHIGLILGILDVGWGIGSGMGPALGGYIFDIRGDYAPAFLINIGVMLLAAASAFWLKKPGGKSN